MTALAPGHPDTIDAAPMPVTRHVTELPGRDAETVTLDLSATSLLAQLAQALTRMAGHHDLQMLGDCPTSSEACRALGRLRRDPGIRAALTLTLDPLQADVLAEHLVEAATPQRCLHSEDDVEYDCERAAIDADGRCADHTADGPCCAPHRACALHRGAAA